MIDLREYPWTVTLTLFCTQLILRRLWTSNRGSHLPLPPGPKGRLIVGNLSDVAVSERAADHYSNLAKQYGDIVFLESLGTKILIVSSLKRALDLFERRSTIYSDRPEYPMLVGEMGYGAFFSMMHYNTMWRRQRREFHLHFNPTVVDRYHPLMLDERIEFLKDILANPSEFRDRSKSYFTGVIIRTIYGIKPTGNDDPMITQPNETTTGFSIAGRTGSFLVDLIPALTYVPDWVPGTAWKKLAKYYREMCLLSRVAPFKLVKDLVDKETATPCVVSRMIEKLPAESDPQYTEAYTVAQDTSAVAYVAGSDTSFGGGMTFFLMLAMHPEVQKRAQEEIDAVVGSERLPDFDDRPQLVYVDAVLREIFRYQQTLPLGLPHATTEDDVYDGYFIPKGTVVIGHASHILHDPELYPDPFRFNPDRFIKDGKINKEVANPYAAAFGFGRRICPGRHMSLDSLYAMITATLAVFDISSPVDKDGSAKALNPIYSDGLLWFVPFSPESQKSCEAHTNQMKSHPEPFELDIKPRSDRHRQLIESLTTSFGYASEYP
ncbi:hypothetical protein MD484_g3040, partial [Candolleomyces efflorescens]